MKTSVDDKLTTIEHIITAKDTLLKPTPDQIVHYCQTVLGDEYITRSFVYDINTILRTVESCDYERLIIMASKNAYSLSIKLLIDNRIIELPPDVIARIKKSRDAYLDFNRGKEMARQARKAAEAAKAQQFVVDEQLPQNAPQTKDLYEDFEKLIIALGNEIVCLQKAIESQNKEISAIGKTLALACERLGFLPDVSSEIVRFHKEQNVNFDMLHKLFKDQTESIKTTIKKEVNK